MIIRRIRLVVFIVAGFTLLSFSSHSEGSSESIFKLEGISLSAEDKVLILAPHPDDEVLGAAGIIQNAVKKKAPVKVAFLTYGDNNEWAFLLYRGHPVLLPRSVRGMGLVRHDEALRADEVLGLDDGQLVFLGYPDFRTLTIWYSHWKDEPPCESMLTHVKEVPYANAFRPKALYKGEEIIKDLKTILMDFKPTKIFLSHPADHNGDHKALYLFTSVALWDLEDKIKPTLYPYFIHQRNWPLPRGFHPDIEIVPPDIFKPNILWQSYDLEKDELNKKLLSIKKHKSQYDSSRSYLLSFIRVNEIFGDFPTVLLEKGKEEADIPFVYYKGNTSITSVEKNSVSIDDKNVIFSVKMPHPIGRTIELSIYVFGYRKDRPFEDMPKLHIKFGEISHYVFDQSRKLPFDIVSVSRKEDEITLMVPLDALEKPERILVSLEIRRGEALLEQSSWHVLELGK